MTESGRETGPAVRRAPSAATPVLELKSVFAHYGRGPGHARSSWLGLRKSRARDGLGYRETAVLRDIDLAVRPGECVGIVGESGSGKTTLGNCIVGLMPILAGEVSFRGAAVSRPGQVASLPRVNGVQMVYQDPYSALNPKRTVGSTLQEILIVHKICSRSLARQRSGELLEAVGLSGDILKRRPRSLSGGMCQRVAIARALAFNPAVLVADEVVSALDASIQAQVLNLIADTLDRGEIAVVFITHDLAVVNQVCDRVVVLHRGEIVESGIPAEILTRPADSYTRSLIAAVPELEGEVWQR